MQRVAVLGAGRVGLSLGLMLKSRGYEVVGACCRRVENTERACQLLGCPEASRLEFVPVADVVIISTPDHAIASVAAELRAAGCFRPGQLVMHTSGARTSADLAPAAASGALTLSFHPLQTFPRCETVSLEGVLVVGEGEGPALAAGQALARVLGARWQSLRPGAKPLYHAAAVMTCNYLVVLLDVALHLMAAAGFAEEPARAALEPLVRSTLESVVHLGPAAALTGPVARGEVETVATHLRCLDPQDRNLYSVLGVRAVELARSRGLSEQDACRLRALFEEVTHETVQRP